MHLTDSLIFVIQEHYAKHHHFDFRLEKDGVLKSWAVPKGIPTEPGVRRLAVPVEDHPLDYATFVGTIPQGEYGAGTVTIWESGTYEIEQWDEQRIIVCLHGEQGRVDGTYLIVPFKENCLILKKKV